MILPLVCVDQLCVLHQLNFKVLEIRRSQGGTFMSQLHCVVTDSDWYIILGAEYSLLSPWLNLFRLNRD